MHHVTLVRMRNSTPRAELKHPRPPCTTLTHCSQVVCRQLGLPWERAVAYPTARFGIGAGDVLMDSVACSGQEVRLEQCAFDGWGVSDCTHWEVRGAGVQRRVDADEIGLMARGASKGHPVVDDGWHPMATDARGPVHHAPMSVTLLAHARERTSTFAYTHVHTAYSICDTVLSPFCPLVTLPPATTGRQRALQPAAAPALAALDPAAVAAACCGHRWAAYAPSPPHFAAARIARSWPHFPIHTPRYSGTAQSGAPRSASYPPLPSEDAPSRSCSPLKLPPASIPATPCAARLSGGGGPSEGRVEMYDGTAWGTVCMLGEPHCRTRAGSCGVRTSPACPCALSTSAHCDAATNVCRNALPRCCAMRPCHWLTVPLSQVSPTAGLGTHSDHTARPITCVLPLIALKGHVTNIPHAFATVHLTIAPASRTPFSSHAIPALRGHFLERGLRPSGVPPAGAAVGVRGAAAACRRHRGVRRRRPGDRRGGGGAQLHGRGGRAVAVSAHG